MRFARYFLVTVVCILAAAVPVRSLAQDLDPFGEREDDLRDNKGANVRDEGKTFSGSVERLLNMAGEQKVAASKSPLWSNFPKQDGNSKEVYDSLFEWRMKQEARKPLPAKPEYHGDLDSLKKDLESIHPMSKRDDEYMFRHAYRADPTDNGASVAPKRVR